MNIPFYLKQLGVCYVHQQQVFPQKEYFLRLVTLLGQNVQGYCPKILIDIYLSKEIRSCCLRTQKIILLMRIFQIQKCNSQLKISHRSNIYMHSVSHRRKSYKCRISYSLFLATGIALMGYIKLQDIII